MTEDRRLRAEYRAFVRHNHPDVGGDPETFAEGIAALRGFRGQSTVDKTEETPDPYDAPIEIVHTNRVNTRLVRWWRRFTGPPRVR